MKTERDKRIYLNPSGMSGLHAAVANMINARQQSFINKAYAQLARDSIIELARLSGDKELMQKVKNFDQVTSNTIDVHCNCHWDPCDPIKIYSLTKTRDLFIHQRNNLLEELVIEALTKNGIWTKIVRDVASNTGGLKLFK